ncbi:MAG: hypothetical protein V7K94_23260 [Nostoc sp.]
MLRNVNRLKALTNEKGQPSTVVAAIRDRQLALIAPAYLCRDAKFH